MILLLLGIALFAPLHRHVPVPGGLEDFNEVETAEDGLGPAFNGNSCGSCHSIPAIGGIATMTETRAGHVD